MRLRNKDIAKELSISTTAVSLALNNKPGVSDETRQKVLEMVRRSAEKTFNTYEHKQDQQKAACYFLCINAMVRSLMTNHFFLTL